ncbi:MAG: Gfo/Idh/MocA family protein [Pseudonocardia sp.]
MRIAIVGFGSIGKARIEAYRAIADVEVLAVVDPSPDRLRLASALARRTLQYSNTAGLVSAQLPIDVLDVCSPPIFHHAQIQFGLGQGYHVLCEKPVLLDTAALPELRAAARAAGRIIYPVHNYIFSPVMKLLVEVVRSGEIGQPEYGEIVVERTTHARGVMEWRPDWRREASIAGGGILIDHGVHAVYMILRLCGQLPDAVSCRLETDPPADCSTTVEHTADLQLAFSDMLWSVRLTWNAQRRRNSYLVAGSAGQIIVNGTEATVDGKRGRYSRTVPSPATDPCHRDWFTDMFAEFRRMTAASDQGAHLLHEAWATALVLRSAYSSAAREGYWIPSDGGQRT